MDLATLVPNVIRLSIILIVLGLGLKATPADATWLFRHPGLLIRSLMGMNVVLPLFAAALAALFDLHPAVEIALVLIAVSPIPPVLPAKQMRIVGHDAYIYGLLVAATVLSIVLVPVMLALIGALFGRTVLVPPSVILRAVLTTLLVPLAAGILVNAIVPRLAARLAPIASVAGMVLLVVSALVLIVATWPAVASLINNGAVAAIVALVVVSVLLGHWLGGPDEDNRTVLALASATRHPGVALAVAQVVFPGQRLVMAAVVLYLLVSAIVTLPYVNMRKRRHTVTATPRPVGR